MCCVQHFSFLKFFSKFYPLSKFLSTQIDRTNYCTLTTSAVIQICILQSKFLPVLQSYCLAWVIRFAAFTIKFGKQIKLIHHSMTVSNIVKQIMAQKQLRWRLRQKDVQVSHTIFSFQMQKTN